MHKQGHFPNEHTTLRPKTETPIDNSRPSCSQDDDKAKRVRYIEDLFPTNASDTRPYKKRKFLLDGKEGIISDKVGPKLTQERDVKMVSKLAEVTRRQDIVSFNWCFQLFSQSFNCFFYFFHNHDVLKILSLLDVIK